MVQQGQGPERDDAPVLITGAAPSQDDQLAARKRRYIVMMLMRIPCLILAGIFVQTWWLALIFVAVSIPLPWVAVLLANDRPARKAEDVHRYHGGPDSAPQLEEREHRVIG